MSETKGATAPARSAPRVRVRSADALRDGAIAGMLGAFTLIVSSLVFDLAVGQELPTIVWGPWIALVEVSTATGGRVPTPDHWAFGVLAVSFGCVLLGSAVGWISSRFHPAPSPGTVLTVCFGALQLSFFAVDALAQGGLFETLQPWHVLGTNFLAAGAMTLTLWLRRPRIAEWWRDLWDDEP